LRLLRLIAAITADRSLRHQSAHRTHPKWPRYENLIGATSPQKISAISRKDRAGTGKNPANTAMSCRSGTRFPVLAFIAFRSTAFLLHALSAVTLNQRPITQDQ
jgi:hypothetical protein